MNKTKLPILNTNISCVNHHQVLQAINQAVITQKKMIVCVAAVHLIMECQRHEQLRDDVNQAEIVTPDGMPLVWLLKLYGYSQATRVYGPTLTLKVCRLAESRSYKVFLFGGAAGQSREVKQELRTLFPRLKIVGHLDTPVRPLTPRKSRQAVDMINKSGADIVFVALGCPLQEEWMIEHKQFVNAPVLIGNGAAFDFISKRVRQASPWIQNLGLEWLFRLSQEPRRLAYRYVVLNSIFVWKISQQLAKDFLLR